MFLLTCNPIIFTNKYVWDSSGNVWECVGVFLVVNKINKTIFFSFWTKIADYTVNLYWDTEGSKSASTSTGATSQPSAFTTFINSP